MNYAFCSSEIMGDIPQEIVVFSAQGFTDFQSVKLFHFRFTAITNCEILI